MSAGTGILHAEFNEEDEETELFQIWIEPNKLGVEPRWEQRKFPKAERGGALVPLASGREGDGSALRIHQDAAILGAALTAGQMVTHQLGARRRAYLVASRGAIQVNGTAVAARDGVTITDEPEILIAAREDSEILLADLP